MSNSAFGRAVLVARLQSPGRELSDPERLPPLFDVRLLKVEKDTLVLSGTERETVDGMVTDFAQTWLAHLSSEGA